MRNGVRSEGKVDIAVVPIRGTVREKIWDLGMVVLIIWSNTASFSVDESSIGSVESDLFICCALSRPDCTFGAFLAWRTVGINVPASLQAAITWAREMDL